MSPTHVLIAGAGLAGPALALALARHQIRSTIVERRPSIQDIGGVISLAPNAMRVMDGILDVEPLLRAKGYTFDRIHIHTHNLGATPGTHVGGFGVSTDDVRALSISRPLLHEILVDACKERRETITLKLDARLLKVEEDGEGVTVVLEGGETVRGDLLIGADGINSAVRKHILGDADVAPKYTGSVFIGAVVPSSAITFPPAYKMPSFIYTPRGTILSFAMDQTNETLQWATSVVTSERERKRDWDDYRTSGQAVEDIKEAFGPIEAEPVKSFINALSKDNIRVWAPYEVPDLPTWHTARTCILGDAAHAISPAVGQGSALAFEDIGLLARLLPTPAACEKGYDRLFDHFEKTRRPRASQIRKMANGADAQRRRTDNSWAWWAKTMGMRALFATMGLGNGGYMRGGGMTAYNVMEESVVV